MKNHNKTIEFFNYMIRTLNIPVLGHRKIPQAVLEGDSLNVIVQPVKKQLEAVSQLIETEEQLNEIAGFSEMIKEFLEQQNSAYLFYELLCRGHLGVISSDMCPARNELERGVPYHARITGISKHHSMFRIAKVGLLNEVPGTRYSHYTTSRKETLEEKTEQGDNENNSINRCFVNSPRGYRTEFIVGNEYELIVPGVKRLGDKFITVLGKEMGKTDDMRDVHLKIVYKEFPAQLKFPATLMVKVNRILLHPDLVQIKAYPVSDIGLYKES